MEKFVPQKDEKNVISLRISYSLLQEVYEKAVQFEMSRNELIIQCIQYALAHTDDTPSNL